MENQVWYHGRAGALAAPEEGLCCAATADVAELYALAGSNVGRVYALQFASSLHIADESDLAEAAEEVWGSEEWEERDTCSWTWDAADDPDVRAALASMGYDALTYRDSAPQNACEHVTLRLLRPIGHVVEWAPVEAA